MSEDIAKLRVWQCDEIWVASWTADEARAVLKEWDIDENEFWDGPVKLKRVSVKKRLNYDPNLCGDNVPIADGEDGVMDVSYRELIQWHASRGLKFPSIIAMSRGYC